MKRTVLLTVTLLTLALAAPATATAGVDAASAFETLKGLEGTWVGTATPQGMEEEAAAEEVQGELKHVIQVSANGTVVMETMRPGTDHEMINMYTIDGDDLLLTHYCAGGNQPRMKLDLANATATELSFEFAGGSNLDPETDPHIHAARLVIDGNKMESNWMGYQGGEHAGTMTFNLERTAD